MNQKDRHQFLAEGLRPTGYQSSGARPTWRISPNPFFLSQQDAIWFEQLGQHVHRFNIAADDLYMESASGREPSWISIYLDLGKPPRLVEFQRLSQIQRQYPTVLRPDVIPTTAGMMVTELDSVPGGMGITSRLAELYTELGNDIFPHDNTIPAAFAQMIELAASCKSPKLAIVVSDESEDYRAEMIWLGQMVTRLGIETITVRPEDLCYSDDGVFLSESLGGQRVDVIYRFFEMFDLPNIANADLLMELNRRHRVTVVPPFRPLFEEKSWFALLHHPFLLNHWTSALGEEALTFLQKCFPPTWILDPREIPPHFIIPGIHVSGSAINSWSQLRSLGRTKRRFVIKPSGFSELAWGGRGVVVGHDISPTEWNTSLSDALNHFEQTPHIIQEFRSGAHFEAQFYDSGGSLQTLSCRARLTPYYFLHGDRVRLASILATLCPLDKKKIHGMPDAILTSCAIYSGTDRTLKHNTTRGEIA